MIINVILAMRNYLRRYDPQSIYITNVNDFVHSWDWVMRKKELPSKSQSFAAILVNHHSVSENKGVEAQWVCRSVNSIKKWCMDVISILFLVFNRALHLILRFLIGNPGFVDARVSPHGKDGFVIRSEFSQLGVGSPCPRVRTRLLAYKRGRDN